MSQEPGDLNPPTSTASSAPKSQLPWIWLALAATAGLLLARSVLTPHVTEGKKLASLSLAPLTFAGDGLSLDDLKGKVVVLNFWGPWCPPCRMELPHVARLADHYAGNDRCRVLAVACGYGKPDPVSSLPTLKEETKDLLSQMQIKLAVYADPEAHRRRAVKEAAKFGGYPTTLVLDQKGVIRRVWTGYAEGDEQAVAELVEMLLEETSG